MLQGLTSGAGTVENATTHGTQSDRHSVERGLLMKIQLLAQGGASQRSLVAAIKRRVLSSPFDRIEIAAAYMTLQGIRALETTLGAKPTSSRWVIGLDDAITQPEAIDYLQTLAGADLRVAKLSPARRFHPKVYRFLEGGKPDRSLLVVGSGNMTERGLHKNAEGAVLLDAEDEADVKLGLAMFEELWAVGRKLKAGELAAYAERYKKAKQSRKAIEDAGDAPPEPPAKAEVAVTIPGDSTKEAILALAVARIAASQPNGECSLDLAYDLIPQMVALTAKDYVPYKGQKNPRWVQIVRNIQSNSSNPGPRSTNFIAQGYLEHVGEGYRITDRGRDFIAQRQGS